MESRLVCGRYTLTSSGRKLRDTFDLDETPELEPRYNIAPTQEALIVRAAAPGARRAETATWGFHAVAPDGRRRLLVNARAETAGEKPAFRSSFARRRCLVPADGFYEWRAAGRSRLPHHFTAVDGGLLALAGLWKPTLGEDGEQGLVFTILTVPANEVVARVHPRMPLILAPAGRTGWLDDDASRADLEALLEPWPAAGTRCREVSQRVNNVAEDSPLCLADPEPPAAEQLDLLT